MENLWHKMLLLILANCTPILWLLYVLKYLLLVLHRLGTRYKQKNASTKAEAFYIYSVYIQIIAYFLPQYLRLHEELILSALC